ncbi:MAG TPA: HAD-IB family phosphatase [Steroidobacteraceae bacterium]|jgi:HAD superfamily phosphoserine phosphatase-like hydrolase|nr:HAD-IB family phosphatase [Steroidobacteraceae bacterium]
MTDTPLKHFLLASDFDQTLSFNDSGLVLAELLGISGFEDRVAGLARSNLVQQGGELAYLIRHDPEFRGVRREHLIEAGRRVRLKSAIPALVDFMGRGTEGYRFSFFVISAAPREIVISALAGVLPAEHIYGTELEFDSRSGEVRAIKRVPAGYGKVAVIEELEHRLGVTPDRMIYVGDGSSDVHVMLHVNNHDGFTIAVSENKQLARIAKSTVLSESAFSIMLPVLDQLLRWRTGDIRELFESYGLTLSGWEKERTDRVKIGEVPSLVARTEVAAL